MLKTIISGSSYTIEHPFFNYVQEGYQLFLNIRGASELTIESSASTFTITCTDTQGLVPGTHILSYTATKTNERIVLYSGTIEILEDPISSVEYDHSSFNKKLLNSLEAFILQKATNNQLDHLKSVIGDKQLERLSLTELLKLRDRLKAKVSAEQGRRTSAILYRNV